MAAMSDQARSVVESVENLSVVDKKAVVEGVREANPDLFPSGDGGRTTIWMTLLIGLFILGIGALAATAFLAYYDKEFSGVIALGTAIVGGVVGLFSKSPTTA